MQPIVTDRVAWSVGLSVRPAKTAQPIEMPFGLRTRVGPSNHVLDGCPDQPMQRRNFREKRTPAFPTTLRRKLCNNN